MVVSALTATYRYADVKQVLVSESVHYLCLHSGDALAQPDPRVDLNHVASVHLAVRFRNSSTEQKKTLFQKSCIKTSPPKYWTGLIMRYGLITRNIADERKYSAATPTGGG